MKLGKSILLILILTGSSLIFAHKQNVHQYIVREAYKLLKSNIGEIPKMEQYIGIDQIG